MVVTFGRHPELPEILGRLVQLEIQMNALKTALAALGSAITALASAVQANTFTADDVATINGLTGQVNALAASLAPQAPSPTPTPGS